MGEANGNKYGTKQPQRLHHLPRFFPSSKNGRHGPIGAERGKNGDGQGGKPACDNLKISIRFIEHQVPDPGGARKSPRYCQDTFPACAEECQVCE